MQDIKIATDCYIPKENVNFYVAYKLMSVQNYVKEMIKQGKAFEYQGRKKRASVIFLKSGEIIVSPVSIATLNKRMNGQKEESEV